VSTDFETELAALAQLGVPALRARYRDVFGEATRSGNKAWLVRRIAWRLQAAAYGGLSERARMRAEELARDADVRLQPPRQAVAPSTAPIPDRAPRLLRPGTTIRRTYKGKLLEVRVVPTGFSFGGEVYASLSGVAKAITGGHCNGRAFFKLSGKEPS
jgi:hypothetical protein